MTIGLEMNVAGAQYARADEKSYHSIFRRKRYKRLMHKYDTSYHILNHELRRVMNLPRSDFIDGIDSYSYHRQKKA